MSTDILNKKDLTYYHKNTIRPSIHLTQLHILINVVNEDFKFTGTLLRKFEDNVPS